MMLQGEGHGGIPSRLNLCGEQVRQIRQERGLSIAQLQEMLVQCGLDLDHTDLDMLEHGQRAVSDIELASLSQVLAVSPDQLVWGETPPDKNRLREMLKTIVLPDVSL
jgi:transcriptional regulator with XRE-family HTH domain